MAERWDEETLFFSGDRYFSELLREIAAAQVSVEMESYIFLKGTLGDRFVAELSRAARRGVSVRLIVDGFGSPTFLWDYWPQLREAGVKIRFFRVIPLILRRLPGDPEGFFQRLLHRWRRLNRGNHRKFALIDKMVLFVGSFNISDVHLKELKGEQAWQDIGVRVKGRELRYAHRAFKRAYRGWKAFNLPARSPSLLLLNDSYLHMRRTRSQHIVHLKSAEKRIWLATPYFVPIGSVFRQLVRQARRGVDVRLIIPQKNDVFFMHWLGIPLLRELVREGVKVFIFQPRFSHQKVFIADDWMTVGSTNLNHRSFLHDLEMDVVLRDPENLRRLEEAYLADQKASEPFDRSEWVHLPIWQRIVASFFILLKYWA